MSHKKLFIIAGAIAAAIVGIIYFDNTRRAQAPAEENNNAPTDETSDWKAYRNEDSGYEIQYPAGWTVSAWGKIAYFCGPLIQVCGPEPHDVKANVSVSVKGETGTLESYVQSPASGLEIVDEVELGGQKAYITGSVSDNFGKFIEKQVHVKHGDSIYEVTAYSEGYSKSEFDRILSTFKFIDSTGTSDWIIYRNEEYGFSIEIPRDWSVEEDNILWFSSPETEATAVEHELGYDMYFENTKDDEVRVLYTETVVLEGRRWTRVLSEGHGVDIAYELKAGEKFYRFGTVDKEELLKQILSTFKFIE